LAKANCDISKITISNADERNIVLAVLKLSSSYQVCYDSYSLNALCSATFDLASAFSTFYNNHKILTEENVDKKKSMLAICVLVKRCLEKALYVLGIDSVEKM